MELTGLIGFMAGSGYFPGTFADAVAGTGKTWTVPAGVYLLTIDLYGPGGGAGGGTVAGRGGGGAGGGAYVQKVNYAVVPLQVITYDVGTAGTGGAIATNGVDGTDTQITAFSLIAGGGKKGLGSGGTQGVGGTASGGDTNTNGVDGTPTATSTGGPGGAGSGPVGGGGGAGGTIGNPGVAGSDYGGGGGGAGRNAQFGGTGGSALFYLAW